MAWRVITEFLASVGYGVLSSFVPIFNAEVYVVATQALGATAEVSGAVGVALGQTIGKVATVLAIRHGTRLPFLQRRVTALSARTRERRAATPEGRLRAGYRRLSERTLRLIGDRRWGVPIIYLSGATGVPPVFAVQFLVPATTMPTWVFGLAMLLGRCTLFLAIAFGASVLIERLLR